MIAKTISSKIAPMPYFLSIPRHPAPDTRKHSTGHRLQRLCLCAALALVGRALAAPAAGGTPTSPTLPPQRVRHALADYARWVDRLADSGKVSGLSTAVVIGDRVRYERSFGYADTGSGERITPDTVFRVASLSKAFSTALAGLLVRDGNLTWDTRIADVLPFFKLKDDDATAQLSVRDLLSQRTGLPHNTYDHQLEDDVPYVELVRRLDEVDLACDVGDCYGYQNVAFSLFGDVVYARTGDFFDHQVAKRLFQPLGMKTASYGRVALEDSASWARPHVRQGGRFVALVPKPNYYWVSPAAGVNASLHDMEQWLIAQMGGRPEVLPGLLLDVLHAAVIATPDQLRFTPWRRTRLRGADYALGWRVYDYAGHTVVFHAGAVEGYRAMIGFLPDYDAGAVVLWNCNCAAPSGLMPMLLDRLLGLRAVDWADLDPSLARPPRTFRPAKHRRIHRR
jgi:beta-lactamase class C